MEIRVQVKSKHFWFTVTNAEEIEAKIKELLIANFGETANDLEKARGKDGWQIVAQRDLDEIQDNLASVSIEKICQAAALIEQYEYGRGLLSYYEGDIERAIEVLQNLLGREEVITH